MTSSSDGDQQDSGTGQQDRDATAAADGEHGRPSDNVDAEMPVADDQMMDSLRSHVPITLLMDLSNPDGPHSEEIAQEEGGDADWLEPGEHHS